MKTNCRWFVFFLPICMMMVASAICSSEAKAADLTVGNSSCMYATISDAIGEASPGDRLLIEGGATFEENIVIQMDLTLQGGYDGCGSGSSEPATIDGGGSDRVVTIYPGFTVTLANLNITNGNTSLEGGGIRFAAPGTAGGTLHLSSVNIYGNTGNWGGGLWVGADAEANGENVQIYNNTATIYGGGVRLFGGRASFAASRIYDNTAPQGGGVYATLEWELSPRLELSASSEIYGNEALTGDGLGGGVYMGEGTVTAAGGSAIYDNSAINGGGVYLTDSALTLDGENAAISLNSATGNGGGVYASGVYATGRSVDLDDGAELHTNAAGTDGTGNGGGAFLDDSALYADKSLIRYNTAASNGGGVYAENDSSFDMDLGDYTCTGPRCSQLSYNTASSHYGGGVYLNNSSAWLDQTFVEGNEAMAGGGIYAYESPVILRNVLVAGNDATSDWGDGVRLYNGADLTGTNNTFAYNDAGGAATGYAIYIVDSATLSLSNSIVWGHAISINDTGQTITCSDIQGGYAGADNLNVNPRFVDPAEGDFHLQQTSPVIDRCDTSHSRDFDNEPRLIVQFLRPDTPYDMGADEFSRPRVGINGGGCQYGTLTQAMEAAEEGDSIQVAAGTFYEPVDIFNKTLTIAGGYDSTCSTPGAGTTTLDARYRTGSVVDIDQSDVTLCGMRITGGSGTGGGVAAGADGNVTLDNVRITGNTGTYGGGVYVGSTSVMALTNGTEIDNNTASIYGGGARVWGRLVIDSWSVGIMNNSAPDGGGVSVPGGSLEMHPGRIQNNMAIASDGCGGGIQVNASGVVTLTDSSSVSGNTAYDGAGIYADDAEVTLLDAALQNNTASHYGGGVCADNGSRLTTRKTDIDLNSALRGGAIYQAGAGSSAEVSNCLIHHNTVSEPYGAGILREDGDFSITHTTIADNTGGSGFSGTATSATNTIAWGNDGYPGFSVQPLHFGCNIDDGGNAGMNADPQFVAPGAGQDYHLQEDSPAVDACSAGLAADLENLARPVGVGYDMGAYEFYVEHTVDAGANPEWGGTVSGSGTYVSGSTATVKASAGAGYVFVNWTDENRLVSCSSSHSFPVMGDVALQANFSQEKSQYSMTCSASPSENGSVAGTGSYIHGTTATVSAYPDAGYAFVHWIETWDGIEGSCVVSTQEEYSFTADRDRNLTAVFRPKTLPGAMMLLMDEE